MLPVYNSIALFMVSGYLARLFSVWWMVVGSIADVQLSSFNMREV
jgi:hypothetical protein